MKIIIPVLMLTICALVPYGAHGADTKIGYVDLNRALNESEKGQEANRQLEELFGSKKSIIDQKGEELRKLEEDIAKQSSILNEDSIKEKQEGLKNLRRDYKRMVKDSEEELQKRRAEYMENILRDIQGIMKEIGEQEGYTMIFRRVDELILYMPQSLDITERVITKLNERVRK